ncbi:exonuclease SbcCD subunit D C-terminal domain-containing protein [Myxococcota bacterium]|nr:exonuclease SbcCD subunit D C-terminal domain-containing protein [Myxococcota bacterium]MBU1433252.1 exonuclease SbcCD subunit D C-terminal domain-containing protein [Myxococcota bacterium]MBU1897492.1 exonuclease SbcCD subunit D C-terminal domain-containing protein [Myxococcota bacterium]
MGLKILHTSDWHLGASLQSVSRHEEQVRFLDWLIERLKAHPVDALIIAGDIFDSAHPSAEAQRLYYRFLSRVSETDTPAVIVIGGNHDSPSRLDAPKELLDALKVYVVGGLSARDEDWARYLCPIERGGEVIGVVAQVPFIHEYRLGLRVTELSPEEIRADLEARFTEIYRTLADVAEANWPDVPLITTGHLTCDLKYGSTQDDAPMEIHMVGNIGGVSARIFDPRYGYVALGHLHRKIQVINSRAWYSGTPIAYSRKEARSDRYVLEVKVERGGSPHVAEIKVPIFRAVHEVEGDLKRVIKAIKAIDWPGGEVDERGRLRPLVYVRFFVEGFEPELKQRLYEALDPDGPRVIDIQQERIGERSPEAHVAPLRTLTPEEVFERLCEQRGFTLDEPLRQAFRALVGMSEEEVEALRKETRA